MKTKYEIEGLDDPESDSDVIGLVCDLTEEGTRKYEASRSLTMTGSRGTKITGTKCKKQ